jgi:hypothetical protein
VVCAGVDERRAELAALEQLVNVLQEQVVRIQHNHPLVLRQTPSQELVESVHEAPLVAGRQERVGHILHNDDAVALLGPAGFRRFRVLGLRKPNLSSQRMEKNDSCF